ncbi:hypothetical protein [Actinomadura citrea]|uniref:Class 3 adenylate cyclase n=1 Tax=Actinomadura citrea TaxID=46158 RepID=A0A7Y9G4Y6_9ACTN|nr:hypothetical protein [Actinomadura citrea]NYE10084.1 class 3 adenylate cyclase [Actinomadura citrea]GGT69881.1 hypothetical protein GCM10010177_29190 [Actinomadura citrea]
MTFESAGTYDNVYLFLADASGYSSIVSGNPRNLAAHAFDRLQKTVAARVSLLADEHGCARAALWSWRGDGGIFAIHDERESTALTVALEAARAVLTEDLPQLREELAGTGLRGVLHLRMAVHKGPIHVSAVEDTGAIHSPDINFVAHLEEVTPRDCLSISEDVYQVSGHLSQLFEPVGTHEGKKVYVMMSDGRAGDGKRAWLRTAGLNDRLPIHAYAQRPSQREKARLVDVAVSEVVDFGSALNTCAGYLVTTERPAVYRDAVLDFLRRGGVYRCVLLNPESDATALFSALRQEDLDTKIKTSVASFRLFKEKHSAYTDGLHVYQVDYFPGMAALCTDLDDDGFILYSPYFFNTRPGKGHIERGDMPHYLVTSDSGELYADISRVIHEATAPDRLTRIL